MKRNGDTPTTFGVPPSEMLLWTMEVLVEVLPFSESTIRRMIDRGDFPAGHKPRGLDRTVWHPDDVRAWAREHAAAIAAGRR